MAREGVDNSIWSLVATAFTAGPGVLMGYWLSTSSPQLAAPYTGATSLIPRCLWFISDRIPDFMLEGTLEVLSSNHLISQISQKLRQREAKGLV